MPLRQKIFESNNKGLFDVAVGEGNISASYATELQNSRVALNGEVSKRRGRTYLNTTAITSTTTAFTASITALTTVTSLPTMLTY